MWKWLGRRRKLSIEEEIDRFQRERMRRVLADNPPLGHDLEPVAKRLALLGPDALGANRAEVRAIGEQLNAEGGMGRMLTVLERAEALAVSQGPHYEYADRSILRNVELAWDLIGDWRG